MKQIQIELIRERIRFGASALGGLISLSVGGMDALVKALIAFMGLDCISGVLCAVNRRRLSSAVGFKGLCKKALILMLVCAAHLADERVLNAGGALRGAVICFYISNEALSLFENAAILGLPVPEKLKGALERLRGEDEKKN